MRFLDFPFTAPTGEMLSVGGWLLVLGICIAGACLLGLELLRRVNDD